MVRKCGVRGWNKSHKKYFWQIYILPHHILTFDLSENDLRRNFVDISKILQTPLGFKIWGSEPKLPKLVKSRNLTHKTYYTVPHLYCSVLLFTPIFHTKKYICNDIGEQPKKLSKFALLGGGKMAQNGSKMGEINVFQKLKGLEWSFLFLFPHFPPHWVHL